MENSFIEYRDKTGVDSESDSEFIDDSIIEEVRYSSKKKNHTVAESDESISNDESMKEEITTKTITKSVVRRSSVAETHEISSSEDDGSRRGIKNIPCQSENNMVVSSSDEDEEQLSPELVPKRRPPLRPKSIDSNETLILRRTKKRMLFLDSDTDNSLVLEYTKNKKHVCLNDTPLKIESKESDETNQSMDSDNEICDGDDSDVSEYESGDDEASDDDDNVNKHQRNTGISSKYKKMVINSDDSADEAEKPSNVMQKIEIQNDIHENDHDDVNVDQESEDDISDGQIMDEKHSNDMTNTDIHNNSHENNHDDLNVDQKTEDDISDGQYDDDDDGPDEDMMVMSRATRMSIMGLLAKDNDSDESDFIQSDSCSQKSIDSIAGSLENLPEVSMHKTFEKLVESDNDLPEISIHNTPESKQSDDELPEVTIQNTPERTIDSDNDLPEVSIHKTPEKSVEPDEDSSKISCSPISSPLHDITNDFNNSPRFNPRSTSRRKSKSSKSNANVRDFMDLTLNIQQQTPKDLSKVVVIDLSNIDHDYGQSKILDRSASVLTRKQAVTDDDVTIIEVNPEIIALSSDDDDESQVKTNKKSPRLSKSPKVKSPNANDEEPHGMEPHGMESSIKQYMVPASYPAQVVYVKKHVREKELFKLQGLQEDLNNVRTLLKEMDMDTLPDRGTRLIQRLTALEADVRRQGDTVANMVVESDEPMAAGLSWEEIQKASNAVQPRMFGRQAMATHLAERNLILSRLRDLHESMASRPEESAEAAAPRLLRSELMPHQLHALAWLQWRETQKPSAGILADDMGLGKTITMIALAASDKQDKIDEEDDEDESIGKGKLIRGGTLVVCPASLIQQWAGEVSKHCTSHALSVCLHHGAARAAQPHRLATYDMVATTYNILQRDNEKNGVLMRIQWRRVILDEAHIVRNHKSATSVAVCNLKGKRRWCLTGTPVQNKDLDLFALLKFLRCSPFDDLQMWKKWIDNKSLGGQERLSTIMRCVLLRRTKVQLQQRGQLACLPSRTPHMTLVTLAKEEMNVYQKVLVLSKTLFAQFLHQRAEKNSDSTPFRAPGKDSEYSKMHKRMVALQGVKPVKSHEILVLLLRLRQVCCHCGLIAGMLDEAAADAPEEAASSDLLRELDKLSLEDKDRRKSMNPENEEGPETEETAKADEAIRAILSPNNPVFQLKRPSSKIKAVMECLNEKVFRNKGDKAVVVSQWTSVLRLVEHELNQQKIRSVTLSGVVPVPARPHLIDTINDPKSDVKVMLLSLCAGGVGINLCGANHLLLLDPHWNPQLEEQAQDRIYRVGQSKDVNIYRFLCVDTVEQTIRKLQEAKLQLAENVLTGARNTATSTLSIEDLKMLFNMGDAK